MSLRCTICDYYYVNMVVKLITIIIISLNIHMIELSGTFRLNAQIKKKPKKTTPLNIAFFAAG